MEVAQRSRSRETTTPRGYGRCQIYSLWTGVHFGLSGENFGVKQFILRCPEVKIRQGRQEMH